MTLISIQERSQGSDSFQAAISFDHGPEYLVTIRDPFSDEEEKQLEWYFEQYLRFPFLRKVQAKAAAESITTYGEAFFQQVFANNPKVLFAYKTAVQEGLNTIEVEISGTPKFHALHWEALKDPDLPQPLALHTIVLRKNREHQPVPADMRPSPTINLLIVAARPYGKQDVGYRTISRPLVETLRQARVPVQVEILRPGTYRSLENHLREVTARRSVGYYHGIHFDVHGAVLTYEQLTQKSEGSRYLFNKRYGRGELSPYEGTKAFLAFEREEDHTESEKDHAPDLVEAAELANLLIHHQVPIAILNACQSGKQVGASETSLGSRLMQAGVQLVLAMGYSVTVSAAELLMRTFYQHLFAGDDLSLAIRYARTELHNHKERRVYFDQTIDLEDWLLPVVYQNRPMHLSVREYTPEERKAYFEHQAELARSALPEPHYGFVGRDLDILEIEKRLLTQRNIVLVRGMGGAGKTTLLHHLTAWWRTTGFVNQAFYFGYDTKAWTRQQILTTVAKRLLSKVEYLRDFQPLNLDAQQAMLTQRLRTENHLLILDNLESITGMHLAIIHTLSRKEQEALHHLLSDLAGGHTLTLLGSRGSENWLAQGTFEDNVYDLTGLDPEAASILSDRVLEKHHATKYRQDADLQQLLRLLDGFPLALEVVLANLALQTPTEVLNALQAGNVTINVGDSDKRTENILRCIEYSHSNLSPEAQQLLICLAPFTSVLSLATLEGYTTYLQQQPVLATRPFDRWAEVLQEASNCGLLSPDPDIPNLFFRLQPILPYFLRSRLRVSERTEARIAVETAFREQYNMVGIGLDYLLHSKEPQERQLGQMMVGLEYENLVTALNLALLDQVSIINFYKALSAYLDINHAQHRRLELGQSVLSRLESYSAGKLVGPLGNEFVEVMLDVARQHFDLKEHTTAEVAYQKAQSLVAQLEQINKKERGRLESSIYSELGLIAQEQRQWDKAEQYYQQALHIRIEFDDRNRQSEIYQRLGIMAQDQRQWDKAEQYYQQALHIRIEFDDRNGQAGTYGQLGSLAREQQQWQRAEQYYQQALHIFNTFNDYYEQAKTYSHLGVTLHKQGQQIRAEQYYQRALQIYIELDDRNDQAGIYHMLGLVAQERQEWVQAEQYYQQALHIDRDFNDRGQQAHTYHNLGMIAQEQGQWDKAEEYYQQALQTLIEFGDHYGEAELYFTLGTMAVKRQEWVQAEQYYQQALHTYRDFNDRGQQAWVYNNLGIIAQEQGQWDKAEEYYQLALQIKIEFNDGNGQANTYYQLGRVAQEQRQWMQAEQYYLKALHIFDGFNDRYIQSQTYYQLGRVAQEQQQWQKAENYYQLALQIKIEFHDLNSQASTYHQLGMVALAQSQWQQARVYFLKALETFIECKDSYSRGVVLSNLALLWQDSEDKGLPAVIAPILGTTVEKTKALLREMLGHGPVEIDR